MTHIRGSIEKIYGIDKDSYTQQVNLPYIDSYSFVVGVLAGATNSFDITFIQGGNLLHSINISTNSAGVIMQRVYLIKYPEATLLGDFYIRYGTQNQFFLGDIDVDLQAGEYIRIYMENNTAGNLTFEGAIWYLNVGGA